MLIAERNGHFKQKDKEAWNKAFCCMDPYMTSCGEPQTPGLYSWAPPPQCSNPDIQLTPEERKKLGHPGSTYHGLDG